MKLFYRRPLVSFLIVALLSSLLTCHLMINGRSPLWALFPFFLLLLSAIILLVAKLKAKGLFLLFLASATLLGATAHLLYYRIYHRPLRAADTGELHTATVCIDKSGEGKLHHAKVTEWDGEKARFTVFLKSDEVYKEGTRLTLSVTVTSYADTYDYANGIAGCITAIQSGEILETNKRAPFSFLQEWRHHLSQRIKDATDSDAAPYLQALLLGEREHLSTQTKTDFRRSGVSHLLALSGLHLTILCLFFKKLLQLLRVPKRLSYFLLLAFVFTYAAITAFPLSLLRAALMLAFYETARQIRQSSDGVTTLFFAVFLIVLLSPSAILDIGLLLSFLATLGILLSAELLSTRKRARTFARRILSFFVLSLITTVAAVTATLFVTLTTFGHLSLITPLSNLLLAPLVELTLLLAPFFLLFPHLLSPAISFLTGLTLDATAALAKPKGVYLSANYPLFQVVLALFSLYLLSLLLRSFKRKKEFCLRFFIAMFLLFAVFFGCYYFDARENVFIYNRYQENDYLIFRIDNKTTVLAEADDRYAADRLLSALENAHITEIDTLLLPHAEESSPAHLSALLEKAYIRRVILLATEEEENSGNLPLLCRHLDERNLPYEIIRNGVAEINELSVKAFTPKVAESAKRNRDLLLISYRELELRYFSPNALSYVSPTIRDAYLRDVDILIQGAFPAASSYEPYFSIDEDVLFLVAYPTLFGKEWDRILKGAEKVPLLYRIRIP